MLSANCCSYHRKKSAMRLQLTLRNWSFVEGSPLTKIQLLVRLFTMEVFKQGNVNMHWRGGKNKMKRKTRVELTIIFILIAASLTGLFFLSAKGPELTLDPSDMTLEWVDNHKTLLTQSCAPNETDRDWAGAVNMNVYNTDGELIYACLDVGGTRISIEAGERLSLSAKIPFSQIRGFYSDDSIII